MALGYSDSPADHYRAARPSLALPIFVRAKIASAKGWPSNDKSKSASNLAVNAFGEKVADLPEIPSNTIGRRTLSRAKMAPVCVWWIQK